MKSKETTRQVKNETNLPLSQRSGSVWNRIKTSLANMGQVLSTEVKHVVVTRLGASIFLRKHWFKAARENKAAVREPNNHFGRHAHDTCAIYTIFESSNSFVSSSTSRTSKLWKQPTTLISTLTQVRHDAVMPMVTVVFRQPLKEQKDALSNERISCATKNRRNIAKAVLKWDVTGVAIQLQHEVKSFYPMKLEIPISSFNLQSLHIRYTLPEFSHAISRSNLVKVVLHNLTTFLPEISFSKHQ